MAESVAEGRSRPIAIFRRPISGMLIPIPVICFSGALLTDLAYRCSGGNLLWVNFSSWLIVGGLASGALTAVALLIDSIRSGGWWPIVLLIAAWAVELVNSFVHARDGWTAVVPLGLILSVVGVILVLTSGWLWQSVRYRGVGDAG